MGGCLVAWVGAQLHGWVRRMGEDMGGPALGGGRRKGHIVILHIYHYLHSQRRTSTQARMVRTFSAKRTAFALLTLNPYPKSSQIPPLKRACHAPPAQRTCAHMLRRGIDTPPGLHSATGRRLACAAPQRHLRGHVGVNVNDSMASSMLKAGCSCFASCIRHALQRSTDAPAASECVRHMTAWGTCCRAAAASTATERMPRILTVCVVLLRLWQESPPRANMCRTQAHVHVGDRPMCICR